MQSVIVYARNSFNFMFILLFYKRVYAIFFNFKTYEINKQ